MPNFLGLYINLERSTARRDSMQAQLRAHGISELYARFPAVDGRALTPRALGKIAPGEAGAFRSHTDALTESAAAALPFHILEDDALLSRHAKPVIEQAIAGGLLGQFDLLLTDTFVAPDLGMIRVLSQAFERVMSRSPEQMGLRDLEVIDVSQRNFACLTSYAVSPHGARRIVPLLRAELHDGPRMPIDLFLRQCALAGKLRVGLLVPFVTGFRLDEIRESTIAAGVTGTGPSVMVLAALRYMFYVERDLQLAQACLRSAIPQQNHRTEQFRAVMEAVGFILSEDFRQF